MLISVPNLGDFSAITFSNNFSALFSVFYFRDSYNGNVSTVDVVSEVPKLSLFFLILFSFSLFTSNNFHYPFFQITDSFFYMT